MGDVMQIMYRNSQRRDQRFNRLAQGAFAVGTSAFAAGAYAVNRWGPGGWSYKKNMMTRKRAGSGNWTPQATAVRRLNPSVYVPRAGQRGFIGPLNRPQVSDAHESRHGAVQISAMRSNKKKKKSSRKRKVKKSKKSKVVSYSKGGSIKKISRNYIHISTNTKNALYGGSGTALLELLNSFCRGLVAYMFRQVGMTPLNWDDVVSSNGVYLVRLNYINAALVNTAQIDSTTVANSTTWDGLATIMSTAIQGAFTTYDDVFLAQFISCDLFVYADLASTNPIKLAACPVDLMKINFKTVTEITVQNETPNGDATGTTSTDSITDNPLEGRVYWINGTKAEHSGRFSAQDSAAFLTADPTTGQLANVSAINAGTIYNTFAIPPSGKIFRRCIKTEKVIIQPGSILRRKMVREQKLGFNDAIRALNHITAYASSTHYFSTSVGNCLFVGLEKMLNNDAKLATIGVEHINTYACVFSRKKHSSPPVIVSKP